MKTEKLKAPTDSLFRRGLLLVMVPAMIQLFGFFEMFTLVRQSERLEELASKDSKITALIDQIQVSVAEGFAILIAEGTLGSKRHLQDPAVIKAKLDKTFEELHRIGADDKVTMDTIDRIHEFAYAQFTMSDEVSDLPGTSTDGLSARMHALKMSIRKLNVIKREAEAKREEQRAVFEQRRIDNLEIKKQLKTRIAAELSLTFVLTFALILLFLRNITTRLNVMVRNTRSLSNKDVKFEPIKGGDEIAYLNSVLEDTKGELIAANEKRASLIQTVSHDIRSPLLSARLAVNKLATACTKQAPALLPQTNSIGGLVDKILKFAEDLLSIEKMEQVEMELEITVIEIKDLIDEVVTTLNAIAEAKEIRIVQEVEPIALVVDKLRIEQVLSNLVGNAIKFSPLRGEIKIIGRNIGKQYAVRITDQGPGVPATDQSKIFDKYYTSTAKGSSSSFGVGLTICKEIVKKHGGEIGVVSKSNENTTFWFTIPIDEEDMGELFESQTKRVSAANFNK